MLKQNLLYKKIIFVCVNQREEGACCGPSGGREIREQLKQLVYEKGLKGVVRVSQSGCMDVCAKGPNVMVFPDNIWYRGVTVADVPKILTESLAGLADENKVMKS
ncbi:MAG: (2Fe-2S) ferredoxin domain-containing protein [Candidatus Omnitrophica bacterium]|nr:(2Fe-2S) ferredoxin domain-containing protein [Candidatus Omnitrophota bacterium]